eukprot:CAMPEP_0197895720 /NCGR_PEP_ID=MMETSP1439-20131203/38012_1 /TAXON_ID=66791 /ORGANISM="Gonyaulax spinifera, Strain CCMP409" /LENGTH=214 /DNA_ID=CAMNT_0043516179 /DNA_START=92 /DNA_END=735 /DNA_ORIENTATION=-
MPQLPQLTSTGVPRKATSGGVPAALCSRLHQALAAALQKDHAGSVLLGGRHIGRCWQSSHALQQASVGTCSGLVRICQPTQFLRVDDALGQVVCVLSSLAEPHHGLIQTLDHPVQALRGVRVAGGSLPAGHLRPQLLQSRASAPQQLPAGQCSLRALPRGAVAALAFSCTTAHPDCSPAVALFRSSSALGPWNMRMLRGGSGGYLTLASKGSLS